MPAGSAICHMQAPLVASGRGVLAMRAGWRSKLWSMQETAATLAGGGHWAMASKNKCGWHWGEANSGSLQ